MLNKYFKFVFILISDKAFAVSIISFALESKAVARIGVENRTWLVFI